MTATRWKSNALEMLEWFDEEPENLIVSLSDLTIPIIEGDAENQDEQIPVNSEEEEDQIPQVLPILPLRGLVVYPHTAVPLTIGQARSIRLVDEVMSGDERMIALVATSNPELEIPKPDDLYKVGTVAIVHRMFQTPDGTIRLVVQGLARCRIEKYFPLHRRDVRQAGVCLQL